jgi:hypothetical protein
MIRSIALGLVLAIGALFGKLPPGEGQPPPFVVTPVQPPTGAPSLVPPSKKTPFEKLFQNRPQTPRDPDVAAALVEQLADKTKVVCGLTMTQVDPNTDPKIRRDLSAAPAQEPNLNKQPDFKIRQPDFKIRRVTPTVCRD